LNYSPSLYSTPPPFLNFQTNHKCQSCLLGKVAHELAQVTRSTETSQTCIGVDPPWLHNLLLVDRSKC